MGYCLYSLENGSSWLQYQLLRGVELVAVWSIIHGSKRFLRFTRVSKVRSYPACQGIDRPWLCQDLDWTVQYIVFRFLLTQLSSRFNSIPLWDSHCPFNCGENSKRAARMAGGRALGGTVAPLNKLGLYKGKTKNRTNEQWNTSKNEQSYQYTRIQTYEHTNIIG